MQFNQTLVNLIQSVFKSTPNGLILNLSSDNMRITKEESAESEEFRNILFTDDYAKCSKFIRANINNLNVKLLTLTETSKTKQKSTPIIMKAGPAAFCVKRNLKNALKALIDNGCPIEFEQTDRNINPLLMAIVDQNIEMATFLLEHKANPNAACRHFRSGTTPLIFSSRFILDDFASLLLRYGADVNQVDANGNSALFYANSKSIALILTDNGADPTIRNAQGKTAIDCLSNSDAKAIVLNYTNNVFIKNTEISSNLIEVRYDRGTF